MTECMRLSWRCQVETKRCTCSASYSEVIEDTTVTSLLSPYCSWDITSLEKLELTTFDVETSEFFWEISLVLSDCSN